MLGLRGCDGQPLFETPHTHPRPRTISTYTGDGSNPSGIWGTARTSDVLRHVLEHACLLINIRSDHTTVSSDDVFFNFTIVVPIVFVIIGEIIT